MYLTRSEYVAEMRRLEAMRNEAIRRHDRPALTFIFGREADLNRVFWGREPRMAR